MAPHEEGDATKHPLLGNVGKFVKHSSDTLGQALVVDHLPNLSVRRTLAITCEGRGVCSHAALVRCIPLFGRLLFLPSVAAIATPGSMSELGHG